MTSFKSLLFNFLMRNAHVLQWKIKKEVFDSTTLINSGVDDELYEDGEKFYLRAKEAGVDIRFRPGPGMVHCYPLLAPMFREATEAMSEIVDFVKKYLG